MSAISNKLVCHFSVRDVLAAEGYYLDAQRLSRWDRACSEYARAQRDCRLATGSGSPQAVRYWLGGLE